MIWQILLTVILALVMVGLLAWAYFGDQIEAWWVGDAERARERAKIPQVYLRPEHLDAGDLDWLWQVQAPLMAAQLEADILQITGITTTAMPGDSRGYLQVRLYGEDTDRVHSRIDASRQQLPGWPKVQPGALDADILYFRVPEWSNP